jgi:Protein of unknown function (DUF3443)
MTSSKSPLLCILVIALMAGCGGGSGGGSGDGSIVGRTITGNNVLSITVNGSLCSPATSADYINKPCVSVTVCTPGTSDCQTINDILLDTGSYGLRIFKQALTTVSSVSLPTATSGSGELAECVNFAAGPSVWGRVQLAGVTLASEPTVTIRLQVIDSTYFANIATSPTSSICPNAAQGPSDIGVNGILGVGVLSQDCGKACEKIPNNGMYYSCSGSNCMGTTVALIDQVQNPVSMLPQDNNGVIVVLPGIPSSGASFVIGSLVLGIGTQANNTPPSGVTTYLSDQSGAIITTISGSTYRSIIDSGSNGLFFTPPSASELPGCVSPNAGWFCPSSTVSLSATNRGASGSPSGTVSFEIGNLNNLISSPNKKVFSNVGGSAPGFDWGLPFYFGRNIYVGIEGQGSSLGSGPYWAY